MTRRRPFRRTRAEREPQPNGSVAEIACGKYTAGHDMHPIAVNRTANEPGIEGTVRWDGTAIFTSDDGVEYVLHNHRPEMLRSLVEVTSRARLLEVYHFLWVELAPPPGTPVGGPVRRAVINVAFEPPDPCGAAISSQNLDDRGRVEPIEGGN